MLVLALLAAPGWAATKLVVTVIEQKSGSPVADLKASEFTVLDDKQPRQVEAADFDVTPVDVMLLLDTSLVGGMVRPIADDLIAQLDAKEQMAIVAYASAADLIQDFTSSHELLMRALAGIKYGNDPRALDALYAGINGGFEGAALRRVVLLATAGYEGSSRISEREVVRLARRNGISIYPVYVAGAERGLLESLARQTGGASFNLRDMNKAMKGQVGARIFRTIRSRYTLTLRGNLSLGEKVKVEIGRPGKYLASALPVE
jgi:VWFA-related protein